MSPLIKFIIYQFIEMKILFFVALVLFFIVKPSFLIKMLKNSFLTVTFVVVIFLIIMCSCSTLTSISSSVIPKTNVSFYGNHASINTPYGNIGAKLPSPTKSFKSQKNIVGHYCKNHTNNRFRCLQISSSFKEKCYDVFLIQNESQTIDTLDVNYNLSLQKFADEIYLLKAKTIVVTIKNGKAIFKNESFKFSNN